MKRALWILLVLFAPGIARSLDIVQLSDKAEVSLLTCDPGLDVYSACGHSAIRVRDTTQSIDLIYNYGTFNFGTKNFYIKFARGFLDYRLSRGHWSRFEKEYRDDLRDVSELVLILTREQKQDIFHTLEVNFLPENRFYRYNLLYYNCATKVRDILNEALNNSIQFDYSEIDTTLSVRQLTHPYFKNRQWIGLGINLCLGAACDKLALPYEHMAIPDYMHTIFKNSKAPDGAALCRKSKKLWELSHLQEIPILPFYATPLFIFWLLFVIAAVITIRNIMHNSRSYWFDFILFFLSGILGIVLVFLSFFTEHIITEVNLNILWAFPLHVLIVFVFFKRRKPRFFKYYFLASTILGLICLLVWPLGIQEFQTAMLPFVLILIMRSFTIYRLEKISIS